MVARPLTLVLLALILSLRALAYASPPDQTWIAGFYDDDDYDDVVLLVTSCPNGPVAVSGCAIEPNWALISILPASDTGAMSASPLPRHYLRGPPLLAH
jgi:hypothetical protein